jgi:NAD(P)-dependent dehydrogenase (short-subunit alcohol dehydrogenase family)
MEIKGKIALVTGGASGIGEAIGRELAKRDARQVILVDQNDRVAEVSQGINDHVGRPVAEHYLGDVTNTDFRVHVFDDVSSKHGVVQICAPAAGITRDQLAVKIDKSTGEAVIYPEEFFNKVIRVNLLAPTYWALQMIAGIAKDRSKRGLKRWDPSERVQGTIIMIGSVSSQGNKGQLSYAASKAGLEGVSGTLQKEAMFHGVRCAVIHPGYTDTPMVRALGDEFVQKHILPYTQLRRLIRPEEIADAVCFMISNSALSGELWADAGWHPSA